MKLKITIALIALGNSFLIQSAAAAAARDPQAEQYEAYEALGFFGPQRMQVLATLSAQEQQAFLLYEIENYAFIQTKAKSFSRKRKSEAHSLEEEPTAKYIKHKQAEIDEIVCRNLNIPMTQWQQYSQDIKAILRANYLQKQAAEEREVRDRAADERMAQAAREREARDRKRAAEEAARDRERAREMDYARTNLLKYLTGDEIRMLSEGRLDIESKVRSISCSLSASMAIAQQLIQEKIDLYRQEVRRLEETEGLERETAFTKVQQYYNELNAAQNGRRAPVYGVPEAVAELKRILPAHMVAMMGSLGLLQGICKNAIQERSDEATANRITDVLLTLQTDEKLMQALGNVDLLERSRAEARQRLAKEPERLRKKAILEAKIDAFFASGAIARCLEGQAFIPLLPHEVDAVNNFYKASRLHTFDIGLEDVYHQVRNYKNTGNLYGY